VCSRRASVENQRLLWSAVRRRLWVWKDPNDEVQTTGGYRPSQDSRGAGVPQPSRFEALVSERSPVRQRKSYDSAAKTESSSSQTSMNCTFLRCWNNRKSKYCLLFFNNRRDLGLLHQLPYDDGSTRFTSTRNRSIDIGRCKPTAISIFAFTQVSHSKLHAKALYSFVHYENAF